MTLRPAPSQLTLFYLAMSAGGALGGAFTALIAPLVFDWVWEHPLLVLAAALLMPLPALSTGDGCPGSSPVMTNVGVAVVMVLAAVHGDGCCFRWRCSDDAGHQAHGLLTIGIAPARPADGAVAHALSACAGRLMLAQGGLDTIYTIVRRTAHRAAISASILSAIIPQSQLRTLTHGTTLHGQQSLIPERSREAVSYYGPASGVALALSQAQKLYGKGARIGIVGLGAGTLACLRRPGEDWRFFEIDPLVLRYSRDRTFTFVSQCAPDAKMVLGDARIELANVPPGSLDLLAVDAFSSDAIPLHLLTSEAFGIYFRALAPRGLLVVHISNRYIELEPVLAALAKSAGLAAMNTRRQSARGRRADRLDLGRDQPRSRRGRDGGQSWHGCALDALLPPAPQVWSDDHASILPFVRWENLLHGIDRKRAEMNRTDITIAALNGKAPRIHSSAFVAPGCRIIGDVEIGPDASIWYNCVLRADVHRIVVGARTNIQDGTVIHCDSPKPKRPEGFPTIIGEDVLIGHLAMVHGCTLEDRAFVGLGRDRHGRLRGSNPTPCSRLARC